MAALVAIAQHRNQHYSRGSSSSFTKMNCRAFHSLQSDQFPSPSSKKIPAFHFNPKDPTFIEDFTCFELWAGPAYTKSPPPSSLPIPKFSLRQKRSVSFELPAVKSQSFVLPLAKSAPVSPKSESSLCSSDFFLNAASATENLKRILNLDAVN